MKLMLEVKGGRLAGKQIAVPEGGELTVGRSPDRASFGVPHDTFMSSLHFAVRCGPDGNRIQDRKSSNGTYLNGARITEAALSDGDEIRSGRTVFTVRIVAQESQPAAATATVSAPAAQTLSSVSPVAPEPPPAPIAPPAPTKRTAPATPRGPVAGQAGTRPNVPPAQTNPALMTVGNWHFAEIPQGWQAQGEFGLQRAENEAFPSTSNIVATEEMLGAGTLQQYVEAQVAMLRQYLREPRIEAMLPPAIAGAEETVALDIRYATNDGQVIVLRRIFVRRACHVGVLTLTTLEKDLEEIRPAIDAILAAVSFQPTD